MYVVINHNGVGLWDDGDETYLAPFFCQYDLGKCKVKICCYVFMIALTFLSFANMIQVSVNDNKEAVVICKKRSYQFVQY